MIDDLNQAYDVLVARLVAWGDRDDDIRAVAVIGSRARDDHPADVWADLDLFLFVNMPERYWERDDWLHELGEPVVTFVEPTPDGRGLERRTLFASGCDVDIVPIYAEGFRALLAGDIPPHIAGMAARGFRVLLDKDGLLMPLVSVTTDQSALNSPTEAEFVNLIADFWYHTVWVAKHLRRGELWWAKSGCDGYLKGLLLRMLEWHTWARDPKANTWMNGRYLEEWADPQIVTMLPEVFAHYDEADVWRALRATMVLFEHVSRQTAAALRYGYSETGLAFAKEMVLRLDNRSIAAIPD